MKHAISTPNQFLPVYDFLGQSVPGVIEYDDETKETRMFIINNQNLPVRIDDNGFWQPVVVTAFLPGSTIEL